MPIHGRGATPLTHTAYYSVHSSYSDDILTHDLKHKRTTSGFTQKCNEIKETINKYKEVK